MNTLDIGERTVSYNVNRHKLATKPDKENSEKKRSIGETDRNIMREQIRKVPTVSSHYCRKNTQRQYLSLKNV